MIHDDFGIALMIFGFLTSAKVKLHPPSSIIRSDSHKLSYDMLNFCARGGQIRGRHSANQLVVGILIVMSQFGKILSYM